MTKHTVDEAAKYKYLSVRVTVEEYYAIQRMARIECVRVSEMVRLAMSEAAKVRGLLPSGFHSIATMPRED